MSSGPIVISAMCKHDGSPIHGESDMTLATTKNIAVDLVALHEQVKNQFEEESVQLMGQLLGLITTLQLQVRILSDPENEREPVHF